MKNVAVIHSLFDPQSLIELVKEHYSLSEPINCRLLHSGETDCYSIQTDSNQYVLRIYKHHSNRTETEYLFEIDWLRYLQEKRCAVSYPIAKSNGEYLGCIEAPEGPRYFTLYSFAEGTTGPLTRKRAFLLGKEIARIHLISNKFNTTHTRPQQDLHFLLESPVLTIKNHLGDTYPLEQERLEALAEQLKHNILSLLSFKGNDWGIIGGDFHGYNQHFIDDRRVVLFDFDLCGYGWRSYDLAVFRWLQLSDLEMGEHVYSAWLNGRFLKWSSFLSGYQSIRRLSPSELTAIPLFVQVRQIMWMASSITSSNPRIYLDADFWNRGFKRLFKKFQ